MSSTRIPATIVKKPVLLVVGAGAGIGFHVARRFAQSGDYHACLCRRTNQEGLDESIKRLEQEPNSSGATGFLLDVTKPDAIETMVEEVEDHIGPIQVAVYNLGAQIGDRSLTDTTPKMFEMGWKLGTFGLFRLGRVLLPKMAERGSGSLLVTSSTAAVRGNAGQHSHAAAMGGRRMLCQTFNAEYASKGIHVAHALVDGGVDAPDTLGKMLGPELYEKLQNEPDRLMKPAAIAETYWHLAHQDPSVRTFELDLRSRKDVAWWNSGQSRL